MRFRLDGIRMRFEHADLDGDGEIGGSEVVKGNIDKGLMSIKETSELGEALGELNKDDDNDIRMSGIDFKSRVSSFQIAPLVAVDTVASMGVISADARKLVRNIMRKMVSLDGKGREELVKVAVGRQEEERKRGASNLVGENQR